MVGLHGFVDGSGPEIYRNGRGEGESTSRGNLWEGEDRSITLHFAQIELNHFKFQREKAQVKIARAKTEAAQATSQSPKPNPLPHHRDRSWR